VPDFYDRTKMTEIRTLTASLTNFSCCCCWCRAAVV